MNSDIASYINNNIFLQIEKSNGKTLYLYGIIIIILLVVFQRLSIGLNIIFGSILAMLIIMYLNSRSQLEQKEIKEIYDNKINYIRHKPIRIQNYSNFVDFIFSIQDMYEYNPPAYEQMIDSIDDILELYEESKTNNSTAGLNYSLVDDERKEAVNCLQSLIFNIPSDKNVINKLNNSVKMLNDMISTLMDEIYSYNKLHIFNNGYNRQTVEISRGPKPENFFDNAPYTFDIF